MEEMRMRRLARNPDDWGISLTFDIYMTLLQAKSGHVHCILNLRGLKVNTPVTERALSRSVTRS